MLDGWIRSGEYGSSRTRPESTSARISRSESSTLATYRLRALPRPALPVLCRGGVRVPTGPGQRRGCSSMVERQLPKLIVRVRFSSPAPRVQAQLRAVAPSPWLDHPHTVFDLAGH